VLDLSFAMWVREPTRALYDGRVVPEGIALTISRVRGSETYWRQLRFGDFDVSEMSMSSLLIAKARGFSDWVALPVFSMRTFFHTWVVVRDGAGIAAPADLHGKNVGVPEYQQTSAVWTRGVLHDEFGVDPRRIHWFMERPPDRSHGGALGFVPPAGVQLSTIPNDSSIAAMLISGELDASLSFLAIPNLVDRGAIDLHNRPEVRTLFASPRAEQARYYAKTGIFPLNHCIVVRRSVIERHPWAGLNLYEAFLESKRISARERSALTAPYTETGLVDAGSFARDPAAYGVTANRNVLEAICRYQFEQGLTDRVVALDEVFLADTLDR
jgi:4,5-dihydroxyphthalate decarboxylase